jgi:hypothetical protein
MQVMMRRDAHGASRLAVLVLAAATTVPLSAQEPTEAGLTQLFRVELQRQFASDEQLDAALRKTYGVELEPDKAKFTRNMLRALLTNDALPAYLAKTLKPAFRAPTNQDTTSLVLDAVVGLQVKGLRRVPANQQAQFLQHVVDTSLAVPAEKCRAGYEGQLTLRESAALEMRYASSLPLQRYSAVMQLYREAMEAELAGRPAVRTVTEEQARQAQQAMEEASAKRVRATFAPQDVAAFANSKAQVNPVVFCAFATAYLKGTLDMPEPYKSWQLVRFVQDMQ